MQVEKSVYYSYSNTFKGVTNLIHSRIILAHLKQKKISIYKLHKLLVSAGYNYNYYIIYNILNNRGIFKCDFAWFIPLYSVLNFNVNELTSVQLIQLFIDSNEYINNNLGANKYEPFLLNYPIK